MNRPTRVVPGYSKTGRRARKENEPSRGHGGVKEGETIEEVKTKTEENVSTPSFTAALFPFRWDADKEPLMMRNFLRGNVSTTQTEILE